MAKELQKGKTLSKSRSQNGKKPTKCAEGSNGKVKQVKPVRHTIRKRHRDGVKTPQESAERMDSASPPDANAAKCDEVQQGPPHQKPARSGKAQKLGKQAAKTSPSGASERCMRQKRKAAGGKLQGSKPPGTLSRRERQLRGKRGVIYIGHLPMGFLEPQLKAFFSQFGEVCRVRLFRSRKNAHSKGYAYVEFALREVAEIAAQAMDKYRMFGRTLVCQLTDKGQVQEHVFRKCHKPFRHINWQSLAAAKHNKPDDQLPSAKGISSIEKRLKRKAKHLQELGIDLELPVLYNSNGEAGHLSEWVSHEKQEKVNAKRAKREAKKKARSAVHTPE